MRDKGSYLSHDPDGTEDEGDVHAEHDLHETLQAGHDSLLVGVGLQRLENEVEVEGLLGRASETRIEQRGVEGAEEAIGDGLQSEKDISEGSGEARKDEDVRAWQQRRGR